jgi:hypothetical protein
MMPAGPAIARAAIYGFLQDFEPQRDRTGGSPRSRSSSLLSMQRILPAIRCRVMLFDASIRRDQHGRWLSRHECQLPLLLR